MFEHPQRQKGYAMLTPHPGYITGPGYSLNLHPDPLADGRILLYVRDETQRKAVHVSITPEAALELARRALNAVTSALPLSGLVRPVDGTESPGGPITPATPGEPFQRQGNPDGETPGTGTPVSGATPEILSPQNGAQPRPVAASCRSCSWAATAASPINLEAAAEAHEDTNPGHRTVLW